MSETAHSIQLAGSALPEHAHVCAFFPTRDEEYRVLLPFIREGLERGEKAQHIVDPALFDDHLRRLERAGIDVVSARASGQLAVRAWEEAHLRGGRFDQDDMIDLLETLIHEARAEGFPLSRLVGHGDWVHTHRPGAEHLVEYESRLSHALAGYADPVVCVYDRSRLDTARTLDLICAHPVALTDSVLWENPGFVPTSQFVAERHAGDRVAVLRERYLAALLVGRERDALEVVVEEGLWYDIPVYRLYQDVVQTVQQEIVRLRQAGRVRAAQEHLAIEVSRRALAQLQPHLGAEPDNGIRAVAACVYGDSDDLGARAITDLLEAAGFDACCLGASVATESLVELVVARRPRVVALWAAGPSGAAALPGAVAALRAAVGDRITIAAAGAAVPRVPELDADVRAGTPAEAVAALRRLLAR